MKSNHTHSDTREIPRKIHVIGPIGSGKSTSAKRIATRLGLPFIELDAIRHGPGWVDLSDEEFRSAVRDAMDNAPQGWVLAGDYFQSLGLLVLSQARTIIWLRIPFYRTFPRLVARTLRRLFTGEELWNGNRESWRQTFFSLDSVLIEAAMKARGRFARERAMLDQLTHEPKTIVLETYREIDRFIEKIRVCPPNWKVD